MSYQIKLYQIGKRKIVDDFIESLSEKTIYKMFWMFDLLEKYGPEIGMPYVRKIGNNLLELRIRKQESVRFLFALKGKTIWIVHGFKKKKNKIPNKDIETALKRLTLI